MRDINNNVVNATVAFDSGYQPSQLLGQRVHYAFVFNRQE